MAGEKTRGRRNVVARAMKVIGYLTDPKTPPGKAFNFVEQKVTRAAERLARNDTYLTVAGGMMRRGFLAQAQAIEVTEEMLRAMRLPTASDTIELRDRLREVHEQVEALGAELEVVVEALERIEKKLAAGAPGHAAPARASNGEAHPGAS